MFFNSCEDQVGILLTVFNRLNITVAVQKLEGPATVLIFLGVEMNTQNLTLRLPEGKLLELKGLIADWMNK